MAKISFVYFDVGGVAIQDFSDSPKWDQMMIDMGLDKFDRAQVDKIYNTYETEVCLGKKHIDTLVPIYIREFNLPLDPKFSMQTYFVDHFNPNLELWPIINEIHETKKIGLLTDIYPGMLDAIFAKKLLPSVQWDQIIDSSVEGVKKPMPEIYQLATIRAGTPPTEILFIDNRQKNLDGAKRAGWQTYWYDSSDYAKSNLKLEQFLRNNT